METSNSLSTTSQVSFSVDAGLIDRLGRELVGKAETAISELIKNAYDADARSVKVTFTNASWPGGDLTIDDDGLGMSFEQLIKGFMTISSTDKVHNPVSERFNRQKAGKKGIGRFATQRLGSRLIIITQTLSTDYALQLTIDWNRYTADQSISSIENEVLQVEKIKPEGTVIRIEQLREAWSEALIKRIFRYVSELFQPDYLGSIVGEGQLAVQKDNSFNVEFFVATEEEIREIASPQKMLFDKSLATISGSIDSMGRGKVSISSDSLLLNPIEDTVTIDPNTSDGRYSILRNVHFKAYYFIYNRSDYYTNISNLELNNILKISQESAGVRLYRNGFRVLPYGERKDDWLGLDLRYTGVTGSTNIPFSNRNLFGFVEVVDPNGDYFQETASREGLIENSAFFELVDFLNKAFEASRRRIAEKITLIKRGGRTAVSQTNTTQNRHQSSSQESKTIEEEFEELNEELNNSSEGNEATKEKIERIKTRYFETLEELGMLRILASLGLTIGEFTHEIIQYTPSIEGYISKLYDETHENTELTEIINDLESTLSNFTAYTSYFNATVSENTSREAKPILISEVVSVFAENIRIDTARQNIHLAIETFDYDLFTTSMHISEWNSILYNLYTNGKKAIKRAGNPGAISIITGRENDNIYLEFSDNGDGIPDENKDRIFNAFFTTSSPAGFDAPLDETITGTGLGLKIIKDIVETHNGTIRLVAPDKGYVTCFRIEVPQSELKEE